MLFHPTTVFAVALALVSFVLVAVGVQFDRTARTASPLGADAGFPLDDAWIHQVYARNLAEHGRLDYNPGRAEAGQSSLLWGVLLAPVHLVREAVGGPVGSATRVFGVLIWWLLAMAAALLVRALPIQGAAFGGVAVALLIALDPSLAFSAASGMEPLLLSLCVIVGLLALLARRPVLTGVAAGLAILSRPEGLIAAAALLAAVPLVGVPRDASAGDGANADGREGGGAPEGARLRALLRALTPAALLAGAWVAFCLTVTGRPLPSTYYAKAATAITTESFVAGLERYLDLLRSTPYLDSLFGYVFFAIGLIALFLRGRPVLGALILLLPPVFCTAVAATRPMPDPEAFFWERYLTPMRPLILVVLGVGYAAVGAALIDVLRKKSSASEEEAAEPGDDDADADETAPGSSADHVADDAQPVPVSTSVDGGSGLTLPDPVLAIALVIVALLPLVGAPRALHLALEEFGANVRDVDATNVAAARWLGEESGLPADAVVAAQDAGAVRYFGGREVVDLIGLNDHRLISAGLEEGQIGGYLAERAPSIFFLLHPDPGATPFLQLAHAARSREVFRAMTPSYSLFGEPIEKGVVVLAR